MDKFVDFPNFNSFITGEQKTRYQISPQRFGRDTINNLIIHIVGRDGLEEFRTKLDKNKNFKKYYDGWERTLGKNNYNSCRLYYYKITKPILEQMVHYIYSIGKNIDYQVYIGRDGNNNWD